MSSHAHHNETTPELHHEEEKVTFGFWMYIMSDCLLFASLFATYAVLQGNTWGGPSGTDLFSLPFVLTETIILLTSSFTAGLSMLLARHREKTPAALWLLITILLGIAFVSLEMSEFIHLFQEGNSWQRSGFLSSFFTLVGTHGLHVTLGSLWMFVLLVQMFVRGLTPTTLRRLSLATLFWHFLDIIWIFIFTIVYLMSAI